MAPIAAPAAAITKNEQKIRRHSDEGNVDVGFEFVIMVFGALTWLSWTNDATRFFNEATNARQTFSANILFWSAFRLTALPLFECSHMSDDQGTLARIFSISSTVKARSVCVRIFPRISAASNTLAAVS